MPINQNLSTAPQFSESQNIASTTPPGTDTPVSSLGPSAGQFININPNTWVVQVPESSLYPEGYSEVLDVYNIQYLNGYLRTQIGHFCTVELLLGISGVEQRQGILVGVGVNYIILQIPDTEDTMILDFYSIKGMTVYA